MARPATARVAASSQAFELFEPLEPRRFLSASLDDAQPLVVTPPVIAAHTPFGPAQPSATWDPSPNFSSRGGTKIDAIVIHTTEGSYSGSLSWMKNPASQVSAHYLVNTNGAITQLVDLANRAWHATYYNSRSIGIEIVGFAGQAGTWNAQNVAAVERLVAWLAWKYDVPVVRPAGDAYDYPNDQMNAPGIVAHGQIQPWNRTDPGPYFPWASFLANVQKIINDAAQPPFKGVPFAVGSGITTTIQAEDYDLGGQGVAFNDTTPTTNTGGAYRTGAGDGVDLKLINGTANQYRLGDTFAGEWVEYTIDVAQAGNYKVDFRVSQSDPNARFHAELDGTTFTAITVPDTNNFSVFTTVSRTVALPAGRHVLRLAFDQAAANTTVAGIDWIRIAPATTTTVNASAATYVRNGTFASQNFGTTSDLFVKRSANTGNTREVYLKFDLSSISSIASAKLRVNGRLSDGTNTNVVTNVYSATNTSWSETGLTWNNKPASGSTVRGSFTVANTAAAWYEVDLTSFLQSEFAAGRKVVTLVLKNPGITNVQTILASDETANGPQLVVS